MNDIEWQSFWWNNITGPNSFVTEVANTLLSKSTVILKVPNDLPWRHQMRKTVEENLRRLSGAGETIIDVIDAVDDCAECKDPGKYLLQKYATGEIQRGYRERAGMTLQTYMIKNKVLRNTIIWVKGMDESQVATWIEFCKDYKTTDVSDGLFVLEFHGSVVVMESKWIKYIDFMNYVCEYDVQLFNSFVMDEQSGINDAWRRYISTLAAQLCQTDAEVSETYIHETNFLIENPLEGIKRIADNPVFNRRGSEKHSSHVLSLWRNNNQNELKRRIWSAQIEVLFPIIEMQRMKIIDELYDQIEYSLTKYAIEQYGQKLSNPYDVELGTLDYMIGHRDDSDMRMLYVPDEVLRNDIHFLRDCRNTLAHGNYCTPEQVNQLLAQQ